MLSCILLAHWNNSPQINMSPHSDTLSWLWANQSLLFLLNPVCLAEKQQRPILQSLVLPDWGSNPRYTALEATTLTITPLMQFKLEWNDEFFGTTHKAIRVRWVKKLKRTDILSDAKWYYIVKIWLHFTDDNLLNQHTIN